ncbi:hypothetical protein [Lignipirellula cremea]|uniref:hypothetical protein n=1 Tax=Lignipirellula cremea TaxID=2528010 RepID=UPI0011A04798|nr:hypothetical protein [Lignipirellula cremea]
MKPMIPLAGEVKSITGELFQIRSATLVPGVKSFEIEPEYFTEFLDMFRSGEADSDFDVTICEAGSVLVETKKRRSHISWYWTAGKHPSLYFSYQGRRYHTRSTSSESWDQGLAVNGWIMGTAMKNRVPPFDD